MQTEEIHYYQTSPTENILKGVFQTETKGTTQLFKPIQKHKFLCWSKYIGQIFKFVV